METTRRADPPCGPPYLREVKGTIFLEVAEPNLPAISLYKKHGWVEAGIRPGYYNQGTITAVVMKKSSW